MHLPMCKSRQLQWSKDFLQALSPANPAVIHVRATTPSHLILFCIRRNAAFQTVPGNKAFLETFQFWISTSDVFVSALTCKKNVIFHLKTQNVWGKKIK